MPESESQGLVMRSPNGKPNRLPSSSLFPSPRLFLGLSPKAESSISPTSTLETKMFSSTGNFFLISERNSRKFLSDSNGHLTIVENRYHPLGIGDSKAIGLAIVDSLSNGTTDEGSPKPERRRVLFGSELKIQIPPIKSNSTGSNEFPCSPIEFGVKTKNSQLALISPPLRPPMLSIHKVCLSPREMELSEDYTRVIAHGPNPRTTHIFDNCIVESCDVDSDAWRNESRFSTDRSPDTLDGFLSFCCACKKDLGQGKDIFMYRGEKAFCSRECRHQHMMFDEEMKNRSQDLYGPL